MALSKRNEGAKVNSDINVTPMVDVMLVLLIIFMVITPMLQHGVSVDLAKVNNPEQMPDADKEDALLVAVMRDGKVYFGQRQDCARPVDRQSQGPPGQPVDKRVLSRPMPGRSSVLWSRSWITFGPQEWTSWVC